VPIADQDQGGVPVTVPPGVLGGFHELINFLVGQVFPAADIPVPGLFGQLSRKRWLAQGDDVAGITHKT
jgi:hypothetical protein